jgi:polar amino acid transport system substrate-binding protein
MRRSKLFFVAFLMSLVGFAFAENNVITISTNNTPLDRKALELLSREAFSRVGLAAKLINTPSERSLQMANQGEIDGEGLRIAGLSQQYPNLVQIPERFIGISFVAFSKDAMINLNQGWESLKPQRIAFITGWKMFEANASDAKVVNRVSTPEQMFRMLDGGRIDLALYTRADGIALIRSLGLSSIAPLSPPLKDVDMYLYLNKKHEALVPQIAQALREMKADGTYNKIMFSIISE